METIIIKEYEEGILNIELLDILKEIENIEMYNWKIIWIHGYSSKIKMQKLEKIVNESNDGFYISWKNLIKIAPQFDQLIELMLIGDKKLDNLKGTDDEDMKRKCTFFIELVDSSFWEITTKDKYFLDNIKKSFQTEKI